MEENKKFVFSREVEDLCKVLIEQNRVFTIFCNNSLGCSNCLLGFLNKNFSSCRMMFLAHYLLDNGYIKNKE